MEKLLNREISTLEFNSRVLAEAMDAGNPLLERLKFIGIVSSNMDEFFMVRIASLEDDDPMLNAIRDKARDLMDRQDTYFINTLAPELAHKGLMRLQPETCSLPQLQHIQSLFQKELLPVLTPVAMSEDRPLPALNNLRLYLLVTLRSITEKGPEKMAVVEIPQNFPRMVFLPVEGDSHPFVLLEDIIAEYIPELFGGYEVVDKGLLRVTRGIEMTLDEEKDQDFMKVMTEAIRKRRQGEIVRLEAAVSQSALHFLQQHLHVADGDVYHNRAWMDLKSISQLAFQPGFDELKRPAWEPRAVIDFENADDIWELLRKKDVLVRHPYQTFDVVNRFIAAAADDPDVLAIKQTLYRTDQDSSIVHSLERAAEKGKHVTVLIELKARFDEEKNIEWAKRLEMAGASVLYGVAHLKTHAKACLVVRREPDGIRRYAHLSTGNYNQKTSKIYSDLGLFTSSEQLCQDLSAFFNMITGYSQPMPWKKIEVAPYGVRRKLLRLIRREALRSTPEKPGLILAKMNSLADPELIDALYKASHGGVQIKLNVRGICCLRPGVKGLSENIEVVSIVDRFLEHSRIFYFSNAGEDEVYLASADWMPRNLDRRIEILFPVDDKENKKSLVDLLRLYFRDNMKSWRLQPDGGYVRIEPDRRRFRVQEALCEKAIDEEKNLNRFAPQELKPQKPVHTD